MSTKLNATFVHEEYDSYATVQNCSPTTNRNDPILDGAADIVDLLFVHRINSNSKLNPN